MHDVTLLQTRILGELEVLYVLEAIPELRFEKNFGETHSFDTL